MVGIFKGSTPINPSLGGTPLKEVYVGSTKVWPALPQRTYEEFLAHIATLSDQRVRATERIITSNISLQLWSITRNGSMEGSPFNANGRVRREGTSPFHYIRPIQHAVHSEAVFDTISSNNREVLWVQLGGDLTGPYSSLTRNGYTSGNYNFQWGGCQLQRILYWDDIEGHAWEGYKAAGVAGITYSRYDW